MQCTKETENVMKNYIETSKTIPYESYEQVIKNLMKA